jgi:hypothetical protein
MVSMLGIFQGVNEKSFVTMLSQRRTIRQVRHSSLTIGGNVLSQCRDLSENRTLQVS